MRPIASVMTSRPGKVVKGSRWLLLRNRENIKTPQDRVRLAELLAANRRLAKVYILRDDLKHLWDYRHSGYAQRFWNQSMSRMPSYCSRSPSPAS